MIDSEFAETYSRPMSKRPNKYPESSHLGRHLWDLNRRYKQITVPFIQAHGFPEFTEGQLNILAMIHFSKPTATQELIDKLGLSKQAVSRMVKLCEENGYLERKKSLEDARRHDLVFSPKGLKLMGVAADAIEVAENEFRSKLGRDFDELNRLLDRAAQKLGVPGAVD